jgi:hypothetical protein
MWDNKLLFAFTVDYESYVEYRTYVSENIIKTSDSRWSKSIKNTAKFYDLYFDSFYRAKHFKSKTYNINGKSIRHSKIFSQLIYLQH